MTERIANAIGLSIGVMGLRRRDRDADAFIRPSIECPVILGTGLADSQAFSRRMRVMPIFSRRRLQAMLDAMSTRVDTSKLTDIKARIESKRVDQVLPAEIELGVVYALSTMGPVEVEPEWFGRRRPDAYTEHLFDSQPAAVEITAITDARLSQEDDMHRVAARLCETANKIQRGQGKHLHFEFVTEVEHTKAGHKRRRKVDTTFVPSEVTTELLRAWLRQPAEKSPLEVVQDRTHVVITWHATPRYPHSNFFSSVPAEAYSLEDNPLYEALSEKRRQLLNPEFRGIRCVVVGDVGSRMLRILHESTRSLGTVTGRQVIEHFLRTSEGAVDAVLVLSPYRANTWFSVPAEPVRWRASLWVRDGLDLPMTGVQRLVAALPRPRFEGYQARSLQQQGAYRHDGRGWYVGTVISTRSSAVTVKISARALLELLAGRITMEQFNHATGLDDENVFARRLTQGDILSGASIEHAGIDEDDDWIVLELKQDPSATLLRLQQQ